MRFGVSPGVEQHADDVAIVAAKLLIDVSCKVQGCVAAIVRRRDDTSAPHKCSHHIHVTSLRRHIQRIVAWAVFEVHADVAACSRSQERFHCREAIALRSQVKWRFRGPVTRVLVYPEHHQLGHERRVARRGSYMKRSPLIAFVSRGRIRPGQQHDSRHSIMPCFSGHAAGSACPCPAHTDLLQPA